MVFLAWSTSARASLSAAGARRDDPPRGRRHAPPPTTRSRPCRATRDEGEGSATTSACSSAGASSESSRVSLANADASRAWERFYRTHSGGDKDGLATSGERSRKKGPSEKNPPANITAFKDRHYLRKAFSDLMPRAVRDDPSRWVDPIDPSTTRAPDELSSDHKLVLELGCGVGNSAFPLMRANLDLFVVAVDCSPTAIECLTRNEEFDERRCRAFCADLGNTEGPLTKEKVGAERFVANESVDAVTGVFFFSALDADAFARVARECARVLKKNGLVLFRDYSKEDVKGTDTDDRAGDEINFAPGQKIDEDAYVRGDGTLAVFFDEQFVTRVFEDAGFVGRCERVTHSVTNRKLGITFERHFVQGRFVKP
jgi:methyltransferase-like protein 6